jgi:hypothetical protein
MLSLTDMQAKVRQGRGTVPGQKKILKIKRHGKITYKEILTMSLAGQIQLA